MLEDTLKKPLKFDDNKPSFYCLPPAGLLELGKIEAIGVVKYGAHSYRQGIEISRYMNAVIRHYLKFIDGEDCDPIDGNSHLGSIAWNALAAIQTLKDYPELDDRYKKED